MATSPTILVVYRAHIVMDIQKTSPYTMYRHKKIAKSLNIQSEFTPLPTSSSFLAVAQYSTEDFIRVWASSSDKTVLEHLYIQQLFVITALLPLSALYNTPSTEAGNNCLTITAHLLPLSAQ